MSVAVRRQPFMDHVRELRSRLMWCIAALLGGMLVGYAIRDQLLQLLIKPLGSTLYYTSPGGGFALIIQLCLGFGVLVATPVLMFQVMRFVAPAIPGYSLRSLVGIVIASCLLVILGVTFGYTVGLPAALHFLNEFSTNEVQALISTDTYGRFVAVYLAGFALVFQLPLILMMVNRVTPLKPARLLAATRWVILVSFIVAAVVTPTPDPVNQTLMAGPIIALYVISAVPLAIMNRGRTLVTPLPEVPPIALQASSEKPKPRKIRSY